jgi:hypothetical protein
METLARQGKARAVRWLADHPEPWERQALRDTPGALPEQTARQRQSRQERDHWRYGSQGPAGPARRLDPEEYQPQNGGGPIR